ncbi:MAG: thiamine pyrophosphate-binding protein [Elusimicrobiales bacterium]|nr:thiamine pyrophosphate-binding protein [Elusimicrobiales bacterium]
MVKLSDYVMDFVARQGVKHVFMLPGGGCMHLVDSLGNNKKLKFVGYMHEQAAAIAADAYAQYTGNLGVALVTTGPGGTNAITAVTASWIDSTPVLVLSGQVKTNDLIGKSGLRQRGIQEAPIVSMVKPVTKYAVTVTDPATIRYHLEKAVYLARSGRRGPVWLDIPLDTQGAQINPAKLKGFKPPRPASPASVRAAALKTLAMLGKARRPVILAGAGIRMAKALPQFLKLARRLKVPVLTTWRAADFLGDTDPLYFGRPGSIAGRAANFIQQNSDFILVLGARLDLPQIGHNFNLFARGAKKVVVDIDRAEIEKMAMRVDLKANCDAGQFIGELARAAGKFRPQDLRPWFALCRDWRRRYPLGRGVTPTKKDLVNTYDLMEVLSQEMDGRDVLVPGSSGSCAEITMQAFKVKPGQRVLNTPGLGSMGFGLPASGGAAIASGRRVVTIIGDGGLQHNIQAYETIARLNLPVKIFILNNDGYGSIRVMQTKHFKGNYVFCDPRSGLNVPDIARNAAVYGLKTVRIPNKAAIRAGVRKTLAMKGPVVCEVLVDPWLETAPKLASFVKPDGKIVSKPLEDLWPFLDREEFKANMVVAPVKE